MNVEKFYRRSGFYHDDMEKEFTKGACSCKSKIEEKYPGLDLGWLKVNDFIRLIKVAYVYYLDDEEI